MPEHANDSSPKRTESGRNARVRFSPQSISRWGWMRSWRPLCWAHVADSGGYAEGSDVAPMGLSSPSTSGKDKSQPRAPRLSNMWFHSVLWKHCVPCTVVNFLQFNIYIHALNKDKSINAYVIVIYSYFHTRVHIVGNHTTLPKSSLVCCNLGVSSTFLWVL